MTLADNYRTILRNVAEIARACGRDPLEITLIAVSKKHPLESIVEAELAGCTDFGENRVQEALEKIASAPPGIRWHLIGSLQKKKVAKIIGKFVLIHSVDTRELAIKISEASINEQTVTNILLQANTSGEEAKHGLRCDEWIEVYRELMDLPGIAINGLMTMAPLTEDQERIRQCFQALRGLRDMLEDQFGRVLPHLSMGMTRDYRVAIEEGATLLRIGTAIFGGERD